MYIIEKKQKIMGKKMDSMRDMNKVKEKDDLYKILKRTKREKEEVVA